MKIKTRLKSFLRHNKGCQGMYMTFLMALVVVTPPYEIGIGMWQINTLLVWLLVWEKERKIDTMQRAQKVLVWNVHLGIKGLLDTITKLYEHIEELEKKYHELLASKQCTTE